MMFFFVATIIRLNELEARTRSQVCSAYKKEYDRDIPWPPWENTSKTMCGIQTYNPEDAKSALSRTNYFRKLVGFKNDANYDEKYTEDLLKCCVVCHYLGTVTHYPPQTARCFSQEAYEACSTSNLAFGSGASTYDIDLFMEDNDNHNLGHRVLILNTKCGTFGFASIGRYSAMKVLKTGIINDERLDFYAYPPPGPCPHNQFYRWSFSAMLLKASDFSSLEVYENSTKLSMEIDLYDAHDSGNPRKTVGFLPKFTKGTPQYNTVYHVRLVRTNGDEYRYFTVITNCNNAQSDEDYNKILAEHPDPWTPQTPTQNPQTQTNTQQTQTQNPQTKTNTQQTPTQNPQTNTQVPHTQTPQTQGETPEPGHDTESVHDEQEDVPFAQTGGGIALICIVVIVVVAGVVTGVIIFLRKRNVKVDEADAPEL
ncbi:CAP domain-containing protein [Histomonas meleagridis]|uniref:CAP domain-containing protein n=1 Tax=Histomonas meleagridis TaxID=135588 RepID=UPI00355A144D|nr:CAP domain-containing protein [Histomonas meleagridis]KAH0797343.1 CAP domain-containing protein [Histomonas meleagridis]